MNERLYELSLNALNFLPKLDFRKTTFKLMCINRNKKIVFVELSEFASYEFTIHSAILPDDLFVLAIFNQKNQIFTLENQDLLFVNLSLKEVYFYAKELHDLDWLYEGDFRTKDSFFYVIT